MEPALHTGKFIIPVRKYESYSSDQLMSPNKTQPSPNNALKEEEKINSFPPKNSLLSSSPTNTSILKISPSSLEYSIAASKVKETFDKLRKSITENISAKLIRLSQKFIAKTESIKSKGESEITELDQHERFLLSQLESCTENSSDNIINISDSQQLSIKHLISDSAKPLEKIPGVQYPQIPETKTSTYNIVKQKENTEVTHPLKPENKTPVFDLKPKENILENEDVKQISKERSAVSDEEFLISHSGGNMKVSKDFQKIENLKDPVPITNGFNFLVLNTVHVLIANDKTSTVHIWNINTNKINQLPSFKVKRSFFGIGFIGKKPAIIGGIDKKSSAPTGTVEVLHNYSSWVQGKSLLQPRSHCHSIQHKHSTYVFAGFSSGYLRSIEKFDNQWSLLNVSLPIVANKFALCCKGDEIYIFGGKNSEGELNSVYAFHTENLVFRNEKNLPVCIEESYGGSVLYKDGVFFILDCRNNKIVRYEE